MKPLATPDPESNPAIQRLLEEAQGRPSSALRGRERRVVVAIFAAFLATAVPMAIWLPGQRPLDPALAIVLVLVYALASRVEFHTGSGWTVPTQLVFVPMLFLLPTSSVPLFVAAAILVATLPEYASGAVRVERAVIDIGDAWHAVGPALVLCLAGSGSPNWSDWPIYVTALAAQSGLDFAKTLIRTTIGLGVPARTLVGELGSIYLIDALLSPIGLLAAFASADQQWAFLLVVPLVGLIAIFAREREARIENALVLSQAYRGTAHLLEELLSSANEYTGFHSRSVVDLAHDVGIALDLDEAALRDIEFAALLHDVGKITVPSEILDKPGALTDEEFAVVRRHTVEGERMLLRIGGVLANVGRIVRSHHENFDGSGYPDGLRGEEIPIAARVISACDAFNAMTTDRPYRAALPLQTAIDELKANAGTQFDPEVVAALLVTIERWEQEDRDRPRAFQPAAA